MDMDKAESEMQPQGRHHLLDDAKRAQATPPLIKATRKKRIAAGAGVQVQEVNRLLKEFEQMQSMMKKMKGGGLMKMMRGMSGGGAKGIAGADGGGMPPMPPGLGGAGGKKPF